MPTAAILLLVLLLSLAAYEAFGEFKLLPRERPTATRRLARNAFQGSLGHLSHDCRFLEAQVAVLLQLWLTMDGHGLPEHRVYLLVHYVGVTLLFLRTAFSAE